MSEADLHNGAEPGVEPRTLSLGIDNLARGIDNYHIDVKLSKKFAASVRTMTDVLVSQLAVPNPKSRDNSKPLETLKDCYVDMMTVLLHRVKTDLQPNAISFLQMAPIKFTIQTIRARLEDDLRKLAARTAELRNQGSTEALASDQKLFWLRKNFEGILYLVSKQIFNQMHRAEVKLIAAIRAQHMPPEVRELSDLAYNPLLFTSELSSLQLLIHEYCLWDVNGHADGFIKLNSALEQLCKQRLKDFPESPLKSTQQDDAGMAEITDELGGFYASQPFLGQSKDTKDLFSEQISWLENPRLVQDYFDIDHHRDGLREVRKQQGFAAWWKQRGEINRRAKFLLQFIKLLKNQKLLGLMLASYEVKNFWTPLMAEKLELKTVCLFLSGQLDSKRLSEGPSPGQHPAPEHLKFLEELKIRIQQQLDSVTPNVAAKILIDIVRYRLHLKYYRLTNRIFNRISLLTKQTDMQLSSEAGTLYALPVSSEIEEDDERIVHHGILKADVRGSTTVTDELQNKGLNPASYFSLRFFDPINTFLSTFGANKVFIEGDAIILSFLEYEHTPQQWFSVARACGMAREMITIVAGNNRHSTQMGLPVLELGIGICYSASAPRFLYDDGKPIMISGAIGLADRLSSCSWNLRQQMQAGLFNIDVFRYAEGEKGKGEKGQHYVRYNVNGILIDNEAFAKLQSEVSFTRLRLKLNGKECVFFAGQYPDCQGKKHELVIREGDVGLWKNERIEDNPDGNEKYYEVVVNRKVTTLVLDVKNREKTATRPA